MDENLAISQFKRDFIIQTLIQETKFEQWLKFTFYLNHHLASEYDTIYQDSFYVKVYELLTEGVVYANEVYKHLQKSSNIEKKFGMKS